MTAFCWRHWPSLLWSILCTKVCPESACLSIRPQPCCPWDEASPLYTLNTVVTSLILWLCQPCKLLFLDVLCNFQFWRNWNPFCGLQNSRGTSCLTNPVPLQSLVLPLWRPPRGQHPWSGELTRYHVLCRCGNPLQCLGGVGRGFRRGDRNACQLPGESQERVPTSGVGHLSAPVWEEALQCGMMTSYSQRGRGGAVCPLRTEPEACREHLSAPLWGSGPKRDLGKCLLEGFICP